MNSTSNNYSGIYRSLLIWLTIGVWLVSVIVLFWFFYLSNIKKIDLNLLNTSDISKEVIGLLLNRSQHNPTFTVVHFVDPDCDCSTDTASHIDSIRQQGLLRNTSEYIVLPDKKNSVSNLITQTRTLNLSTFPSVNPIVGVWDTHGGLVYFGPYSTGMTCGQGEDFLRNALQTPISTGVKPVSPVSCFCSWPS